MLLGPNSDVCFHEKNYKQYEWILGPICILSTSTISSHGFAPTFCQADIYLIYELATI